jgi:hypothetical protein
MWFSVFEDAFGAGLWRRIWSWRAELAVNRRYRLK